MAGFHAVQEGPSHVQLLCAAACWTAAYKRNGSARLLLREGSVCRVPDGWSTACLHLCHNGQAASWAYQ